MGEGDLKQPRLRAAFSVADWVQHKFRYLEGRFLASHRGHREVWAFFNTMLLEASKAKGSAYHKATDANVLTKAELRELVTEQDNLVRELATFGADIPTTPMFWKRETNRLEWIVKQMSWRPGWVPDSHVPQAPEAAPAATLVQVAYLVGRESPVEPHESVVYRWGRLTVIAGTPDAGHPPGTVELARRVIAELEADLRAHEERADRRCRRTEHSRRNGAMCEESFASGTKLSTRRHRARRRARLGNPWPGDPLIT